MDPEEQIAKLEAELEELKQLVRAQHEEGEASASAPPKARKSRRARKPRRVRKREFRQLFQKDVRRNVDKVLGGDTGETLESRIGGIWLSRVAVVLFMTAAALGARVTLYTDVFAAWQKVLVAYSVTVIALVYGFVARKKEDLFSQTILGTALAGVYFITYGAFFTEGLQVSSNKLLALPLLLVCLLFLVGVSHWRRSQTVAGIALFLVYYTVVASCMGGRSAENITYALVTCAILAAVTLAFHALHRWLLFTWVALIATYLTYMFYFLRAPAGLVMSDTQYFWLSNGFLTVCYVLFSFACILDARKTGEYRRTVAPMAGVNSFVYFALTWIAIREHYVDYEWAFRLGFAACLFVFALFAEMTGPRRNYLFQIFIAKVVIMITLALQAYFSGEKLMVAIAVECLALSFSYKRSGVVTFKILGVLLLLVTFIGCFFHMRPGAAVAVWGFSIPANWFCCGGTAAVLTIVAWFYEQFVWRPKPEDRVVTGQWFLAETFLDVRSATMAMLHAAAAALILLTVTIIDVGDTPALPYILGAESVAMATVGFMLRTPQVEVASVLLLAAAHLCYHAFLLLGIPGFREQPHYGMYTVLVAMFTYFGAYLWERYLHRVKGGKQWEHDVTAAIPYLAATFMLTTLLGHELTPIQAPLAHNALGGVLLLVGLLTHFRAVKASGVMALTVGTATFYRGLYDFQAPLTHDRFFLSYLIVFLATYVAGERLFALLQKAERAPSRAEAVVRTILVALLGTLGALSLYNYCQAGHVTFFWLALAVAGFVLGAVFYESRYRWAAMALFGVAVARAFYFDLQRLPLIYQFLSFAALSGALLVISWAYSRYRQSALRSSSENPPDGSAPDG